MARRCLSLTRFAAQVSRQTVLLALGMSLVACGGDGKPPVPTSCPDVLPSSCPDAAPSYAVDVAPILSARCGACHSPGKVEAAHSFETFARVAAQSMGIRIQIDSCIMPPFDQPQPTAEERRAVLAWVVCGASDN